MIRKAIAALEVLALCAVLLTCASVHAAAAPASPRVHVLTQPNGATFEARLWGDEWMHGWETLDGYTILLDETRGIWEYAVRSSDGRLASSGCPVAPFSPDAVPRGVTPKMRPDSSTYLTMRAEARGIEVARPGKVMNLPVLLVGFPDMPGEYSRGHFDELLFGDRPAAATGPGSLRDYYLEASYGALALSGGAAGVQGWFTASANHDYYGSGASPEGLVRAAKLVRSIVLMADAFINFADYDCDGDGHVDSIVVIHAGPGAENTGDPNDIWSHSWSLLGAGLQPLTLDGVTIDSYTIQPERMVLAAKGAELEFMSTIGVFAHELGHTLGLPDLYDIDYVSAGVGDWCLMASGNWNGTHLPGDCPAHLCAWCKWLLGWANPVLHRSFEARRTFRAAASAPDVVQILPNPDGPADWPTGWAWGEYFLVENRFQTGFDAALPGSGLAIWHVDEYMRGNRSSGQPHKLVDLEEADGLCQLDTGENRGDAGDLYPGSFGNRSFSFFAGPDSRLYDGRCTGVAVTNVSNAGETMTADLVFGIACDAPYYDDMGAVLHSSGFDYFDMGYARRHTDPPLDMFDVVFVNCSKDTSFTFGEIRSLQEFVRAGGELYLSDWAWTKVNYGFPGYVEFLGSDPRIGVGGQTVDATVHDPSLIRALGTDRVPLTFDAGYWVVINSASHDTDVVLSGDITVDPTNPPRDCMPFALEPAAGRGEILKGRPLAVAFAYGQGRVFYTSYHLHAQPGGGHAGWAAELACNPQSRTAGLVQLWNAMCTMTSCESAAARTELEGRRYVASDKIVGSVRCGCDAEYRVLHPGTGALAFAVGSSCGAVDVCIQAPGGDRFELKAAGDRPAVVEIPDAEGGEWHITVASTQGPLAAAFVVCVGRREAGGGGPDASDNWVRFGPNPATHVLNVYYSLPGSGSFSVFDISGRIVYTQTLPANGSHLEWDLAAANGRPLANGLYLAVVRSAEGKALEVFRLLVQR